MNDKSNPRPGDEWTTPPELYRALDALFHFTLDPAASNANHLAPTWYTREQDGLARPWTGRVFCNPPYSRPAPWVARAWASSRAEAELVVMLLPVDTTTQWFNLCWQMSAEILFFYRRLTYGPARPGERRRTVARFASCLVLFTRAPGPTLAPLYKLGRILAPDKEIKPC